MCSIQLYPTMQCTQRDLLLPAWWKKQKWYHVIFNIFFDSVLIELAKYLFKHKTLLKVNLKYNSIILSIHPSFCLTISISFYRLSDHPSVWYSFSCSIHPLFYKSFFLSFHPCICPSIHSSICQSIVLSIILSIIHPSIHCSVCRSFDHSILSFIIHLLFSQSVFTK